MLTAGSYHFFQSSDSVSWAEQLSKSVDLLTHKFFSIIHPELSVINSTHPYASGTSGASSLVVHKTCQESLQQSSVTAFS